MADIPNIHEFIVGAREALAKDYPAIGGDYAAGLDYGPGPAPLANLPNLADDTGLTGFVRRMAKNMNSAVAHKILCNVESTCAVIRYLGFEVSLYSFQYIPLWQSNTFVQDVDIKLQIGQSLKDFTDKSVHSICYDIKLTA